MHAVWQFWPDQCPIKQDWVKFGHQSNITPPPVPCKSPQNNLQQQGGLLKDVEHCFGGNHSTYNCLYFKRYILENIKTRPGAWMGGGRYFKADLVATPPNTQNCTKIKPGD